MNDFLKKLAADREKAAAEGSWRDWTSKHGNEGVPIWDFSQDPSIVESVRSFLAMVPNDLCRWGLIADAPPSPQSGWGEPHRGALITMTTSRFIGLEDATDAWRREGTRTRYVPAVYVEEYLEGGIYRNPWNILEDGRRVATLHLQNQRSIDEMYEAMSAFVRGHQL